MKTYLYYPGCSLTGTAREYDLSVRALANELAMGLVEIEDWTCCGATAAQAVDTGLALALGARNLALAEKTAAGGTGGDTSSAEQPSASTAASRRPDILVPCSACYLNLRMAGADLEADKEKKIVINGVLAGEGLALRSGIRVRHLLDVLSRDVAWGGERDADRTGDRGPARLPVPEMAVDLSGIVAAPYYGCQCLRPFRVFDDPEAPRSMEAMIRATGARVLAWEMGGECCGASHGTTKPEAGRRLTGKILSAARAADCIVTVCPMCQMNLELFQDRVHPVPVLYLPQFLGMALGISARALGLSLNLTDSRELLGG